MTSDIPSDLIAQLDDSYLSIVEDWWDSLAEHDRKTLVQFSSPFFPSEVVGFSAEPETPPDDTPDDYLEFLMNHEFKGQGPFMSDAPGQELVLAVPLLSPLWPPYPEATRFQRWARRGRLS